MSQEEKLKTFKVRSNKPKSMMIDNNHQNTLITKQQRVLREYFENFKNLTNRFYRRNMAFFISETNVL